MFLGGLQQLDRGVPDQSGSPTPFGCCARLITFLVDKGLLPPERARILRGWKHTGFNVQRSRRVLPEERDDLERLSQYMIRNPFSIEKMQVNPPHWGSADSSIIYRSGMNPKIQRNFEVFPPQADPPPEDSPCDFIAKITRHIPDKSFQLVRYYGWYSNKMRGQRDKHAAEEAEAAGKAVEVIDVSGYKPRRVPLPGQPKGDGLPLGCRVHLLAPRFRGSRLQARRPLVPVTTYPAGQRALANAQFLGDQVDRVLFLQVCFTVQSSSSTG